MKTLSKELMYNIYNAKMHNLHTENVYINLITHKETNIYTNITDTKNLGQGELKII